jgi:hypothetical protein
MQKVIQKAKRGAPIGNQNRWVHGRRSRAFLDARKLTGARLKVAAHIAVNLGWIPGRCRARPIRLDQVRLLERLDPELLAVARDALGALVPQRR